MAQIAVALLQGILKVVAEEGLAIVLFPFSSPQFSQAAFNPAASLPSGLNTTKTKHCAGEYSSAAADLCSFASVLLGLVTLVNSQKSNKLVAFLNMSCLKLTLVSLCIHTDNVFFFHLEHLFHSGYVCVCGCVRVTSSDTRLRACMDLVLRWSNESRWALSPRVSMHHPAYHESRQVYAAVLLLGE